MQMFQLKALFLASIFCANFLILKSQSFSKPCVVDTHGRLLDTDDDGIADCLDKEKLTKQECFPVDPNGVGTCPEPACCYKPIVDDFSCKLPLQEPLHFTKGYLLSEQQKNILDSLQLSMMNNPQCMVTIKGYYSSINKFSIDLTSKRIQQIRNYIISHGAIAEERIKISLQIGTYLDYISLLPSSTLN